MGSENNVTSAASRRKKQLLTTPFTRTYDYKLDERLPIVTKHYRPFSIDWLHTIIFCCASIALNVQIEELILEHEATKVKKDTVYNWHNV